MSNEVWIAMITGGFTLAGVVLSGLFRFGEQRRQAKREQLDKAMQNLQFFYGYEKVLLAELAKCTGKAAETLKKELRVVAGGPNATPSLTRPVAVREYLVKQKLLTATAESLEEEE